MRSGAVSVQHFVDNVLNPGVDATWPFLEAVFGELADRFPSPWLHLGGDEVPHGAWRRSPAAQRWAAEQGIDGADAIAAAFLRQVIDVVRASTGRQVGVWQEAAESGALDPGAGYVVGVEVGRRRPPARVGRPPGRRRAGAVVLPRPRRRRRLVVAGGELGRPGVDWMTSTRFDVTAGWSAGERAALLGIQACLWTEHVHDLATLRRLLLPRLTAIADAAWTATNRF